MTCRYSNMLHLLPILPHRRTHFHFHPYVTTTTIFPLLQPNDMPTTPPTN